VRAAAGDTGRLLACASRMWGEWCDFWLSNNNISALLQAG